MLQPRESENREIKDISGMWIFRADNSSTRNEGFEQAWYKTSLRKVIYYRIMTQLFVFDHFKTVERETSYLH